MKTNGIYKTFHRPVSQEWIDGRHWPPALICHINQTNENLITLIHEYLKIM